MRRHRNSVPFRHRQWQCPCGARLSMEVQRTEHDEDGYPIRIRKCKNCGEPMATAEHPIPLESFYARANSHIMRNQQIYHRTMRRCSRCARVYGENSRRAMFRGGTYSMHVTKQYHLATLSTNPTSRSRQRERVRAKLDYWRKRGFHFNDPEVAHRLQMEQRSLMAEQNRAERQLRNAS